MGKLRVYPALRELYEGFSNEEGKILDKPNKRFKSGLSNRQVGLFVGILKVFMDTDLINEESKMYIRDKNSTIDSIHDLMVVSGVEEITKNNTLSRIMYGKKKIEKYFSDRFYVDIISNINLDLYEEMLKKAVESAIGKSELREQLVLDIPVDYICKELSEEEFNDFIMTIAPYSKRQVKFVEENLSRDAYGYFNHILSDKELSGVDKERAQFIEGMLIE